MQGPDYIFFIQDAAGRFWKRDEYGNVIIATQPSPLQFSPDAWREVSLMLERNKKYWGMERSSTVPLRHVEDGAAILKHHYYTFGISADLFLSIAEQKLVIAAGLYSFEYDLLYNGKYDFSTFNHQGAVVTCNTVEGGLGMYIKTNENTVYSIPMDVAENVNVYHDGIILHETGNYQALDGVEILKSVYGSDFWIPMFYVNSDGDSSGISFLTQRAEEDPTSVWADKVKGENYILKADPDNLGTINMNITGTFNFKTTNQTSVPPYALRIRVLTSTMLQANQSAYILVSTNLGAVGSVFSIPVNVTIPVKPNEKVFFQGTFFGGLGANVGFEFTPSLFKFQYQNRYKPTICKSLPLMYVAKELVKKMSDGLFSSVSSTFIDGLKIQLTCGDALRQLPGAAIRISWSQLFNSINVSENIGAAPTNNILVIERKEYWFETTKNIALGAAIGDPMYSPAVDYLFNTLKIGWPNQDYETLNGKGEFNTTALWTLPVIGIAKELTLVSDVRADITGIEEPRINFEGRTTTNSGSDNDNFFLKVGEFSDGTYKLDRSLNATATGLIDAPSAYNIYFSPKRCLLRHGWFLRSCLDKLDNKWIKFQTLDKNRDLACDGIDEDADILIADLPARKFIPVMAEMEVSSPEFPMDNGVRTYSFIDSFVPFSGIAMRTGIQPSTQKTQQFQLLLKPDADLTKLIDIYE